MHQPSSSSLPGPGAWSRRLGYIRAMAGGRPIAQAKVARVALLTLCVACLAAAPASARTIYINVELSQAGAATHATGERWQSAASVSAYYRTSSQALAAGDGTVVLMPRATLGRFTATLTDALPGLSRNCAWRGAPGGGRRLAELQEGTPFAHALSIQWPGYPGMWKQSLSGSSTGRCTPTFTENPLQGAVRWTLGSGAGTGGGNHFIFAAVPRSAAVESRASSASIAEVTMRSLLTSADGAIAAVAAQGFLVESTVPFAGRRRDVLPAAAISAGGALPAPLSARALRALGSELVPNRVPSGCIAGHPRRRHQRCP
jgi:hypothetical protein